MQRAVITSLLFLGHFISFGQSVPSNINFENVQKLIHFCDSTMADEILLTHEGITIAEWNRPDCDSTYMNTASMVKSWTGLLIGILIDKKIIDSIEARVCEYIPEWEAGCRNNITIKHLLTMTAGLNKTRGEGVLSKRDMNQYVVNLIPDTLPDIRFSYSNESAQLLGVVIERATGKSADQVFNEFLFYPLGMYQTSLASDSAGNVVVYGGCKTTVKDAIKIGQLMLNDGTYKGKQIVSKKWIEDSVTPGPHAQFYGYLWWIDRFSPQWNFAATGDLGQMTIVFPDLNIVFVRRQNCDLSPVSLKMGWMGPHFLKLITDVVKM